MKKALSILLTAMMVVSLCACSVSVKNNEGGMGQDQEKAAATAVTGEDETVGEAVAREDETETAATEGEDDGESVTFEQLGLTVHYSQTVEDAKGIVVPRIAGEVSPGVSAMYFLYFGMPQEDFSKLTGGEDLSEEESEQLWSKATDMLYVFSASGGKGPADILKAFNDSSVTEEDITEIGSREDVKYYTVQQPVKDEKYMESVEPEYAQEYPAVRSALVNDLKGADFFDAIFPGKDLIGKVMQFETTDLDGNTVKSEDIFAQNKVTMVNIWGTWCGPCKAELKELGEMHRRLASKGAAVIGICEDADINGEECRRLLEENNVDYLNLLPFENMAETLEINAFPTSFFVGSDGTILCAPMRGAPADASPYEERIDALLNDM